MAAATTQGAASIYAFIGELQRFFRSRESELGIGSTFGAMADIALGGGGGTPHDHDGRMVALVDRSKTLTSFRVVWRALRRLEEQRGGPRLVVTLHLLYGHTRDPDYPAGLFGDLRPIVHLTDAANRAREETALAESEETMTKISADLSDEELAARRTVIAETFWRLAARHAKQARYATRLAHRCADGLATAEDVRVANAKAGASWRLLGTLLREYDREPRTGALISACVHADKAWSPMRAVIERLTRYDGPRDADGKPIREAHAAWRRARDEWASVARAEAEALRTEALTAYRVARLEAK